MADVTPAETPNLSQIIKQVTHSEDSLEIVFTDKRKVACDGPGGGLGHPRTFYTIGAKGYVECGYCDRVFVYDPERAGERIEGGTPAMLALKQG